MMKRFLLFLFQFFAAMSLIAQEVPNAANATQFSPNTAAGALAASTGVNYFIGIPSVSIPLYSYSGKGMNFSISADYIGGGIKDGETPSIIGMGWNLNAGGLITRTVRGIPDDDTTHGFIKDPGIPIDFRSKGDKYYYDTLDAQPDIFQFNFNGRSGKFYIGKNQQIVTVPQTQLKIQYTTDATSLLITGFTITAENGVRYVFNTAESTKQTLKNGNNIYKSAYTGKLYYSAWYLSQIIAPFGTDTIKLTYTSKQLNTSFSYPAISIVNAVSHIEKSIYHPSGTNTSTITKLASIIFPDKTQVTLQYSNYYQYDDTDYALSHLKVSDSVFRRGYQFDYQTNYSGNILKYDVINEQDILVPANYKTNLLLKSITPYTSKEITKGYSFSYNVPYPNFHDYSKRDSVLNAYDHWGYFNGWRNDTNAIPYIAGINTHGANRNLSGTRVIENSLSYISLPGGGVTHYEYEPNTIKDVSLQSQNVSLSVNSSYNISLSQAFNNIHELAIYPLNVDRSGTAPFSGACNLVLNIKSTDGSVLYGTTTISLYDLFYLGLKKWMFAVPANGTYRLESSLSGGGTVPGSYSSQFTWTNKVAGTANIFTGGIRILRITSQTASNDSTHKIVEEFKYNTSDGKSSGFLGDIPEYYYYYKQTITSPSSTTGFNIISSDPISNLNTAQGNTVGYSHVEVYRGTASKNLGKTVYEFTNLTDVGSNYFHAAFPYAPGDIKEWGLGLPKRVMVYDSSGNLETSTTNQYSFSNTVYNANSNFKGLKLGLTATTYATDPDANPTTARTNTYIGQEYFISSGRYSLDQTTDSAFYTDGSVQTKSISYTYDSYYNLIKATTLYDKTKGLNLETRIYYPYNYTLSSGAIKTLKDSNIISQPVSTEKWIVGDANPRIVDATISNYYQLAQKYIVPQHVYTFQSNKPVNQSTIGTFNASSLVRNSAYFIEQSSMPVYYTNGTAAQQTNMVSGISSSIILDYNNHYTIAKISNAAFSDVAYTSFESDGSGNWTITGTARSLSSAITGKYSYNLSNGNITKNSLGSSLTYLITFWLKSGGSATVNGSSIGSSLSIHNGWKLYSVSLSGITSVTISGSGYIDELRLHPANSNMITYTYEPNIGVTSTCDANNTILYTQYDNLNRLKLVRDIDSNILKRYDYSDNTTAISITPNWVRIQKVCTNGGAYDSVYEDQNPYSDSYLQRMNVFKGYDYCGCTTNPQYKIVNDVCEMGVKSLVGSSHVRHTSQDQQSIYYDWHCDFRYTWSNGSTYNWTEIHPDSETNPCSNFDPQ